MNWPLKEDVRREYCYRRMRHFLVSLCTVGWLIHILGYLIALGSNSLFGMITFHVVWAVVAHIFLTNVVGHPNVPPIVHTTGFQKFAPFQFLATTSPVTLLMSFSDIGIFTKLWHILVKDVGVMSLSQAFMYTKANVTLATRKDLAGRCDGMVNLPKSISFTFPFNSPFMPHTTFGSLEKKDPFGMYIMTAYAFSLVMYMGYVMFRVRRRSAFPTIVTWSILRKIFRDAVVAEKWEKDSFKKLLLLFTLNESNSRKLLWRFSWNSWPIASIRRQPCCSQREKDFYC